MSDARLSPSGQQIGETLPDGTYAGQPVAWDAAAEEWLPLPLGNALVFAEWDAPDLMFQVARVIQVEAADQLAVLTAEYTVDIDASTLIHGSGPAGWAMVGDAIALQDAAGFASLELDSGEAVLSGGEGQALILDTAGARLESSAIGFFDAAPIAKPAVVGATLALQLGSLLTQLQALGLITDSVVAPGQLGLFTQSLGYTLAAPLVIQLLPAGHAPGIYLVSYCPIVRTTATGNLGRSLQYTAFGGSTAGLGNQNATLVIAGPLPIAPSLVPSNGATALNMTLTPAGVVGSPVVDIYVTVVMQSAQ